MRTASAVLVGIFLVIVPQVADSFDTLSSDVGELVDSGRQWLIDGPLGLTEADIEQYPLPSNFEYQLV